MMVVNMAVGEGRSGAPHPQVYPPLIYFFKSHRMVFCMTLCGGRGVRGAPPLSVPPLPFFINGWLLVWRGGGSRGPRLSWRSSRSFRVYVNRKGVIKHSFFTKTVSLVLFQCRISFYLPLNTLTILTHLIVQIPLKTKYTYRNNFIDIYIH